jgi:transcriptional regulator with XRE-family HTH domain
VHYLTGITQSQIARFELGTSGARVEDISALADIFGMEDYELLQYKSPIPDADVLKKNISKYLKNQDIDPVVFLKQGLVHLIETKLLPSKFFTSLRFTKEISAFLEEKERAAFSTSHISQALNGFVRKGLVEKVKTGKKTKYQYRSKA